MAAPAASAAPGSAGPLVGNRLALAGAVLYFLEWVVIVFLPETGDPALLGRDAAAVVELYRDHAVVLGLAAGWFGLVLPGRILFVAALRKALHDSGRDTLLVDVALGAMVVSVAIEVASFGPSAAAGWLAETGGDASAIVALDAAAGVTFLLVFVPLGASLLAASLGMLQSRLFPRPLVWLGLAAGAVGVVGGIVQLATLRADGPLATAAEQATGAAALGFWLWLLVTGIILWPARRPGTRVGPEQRRRC